MLFLSDNQYDDNVKLQLGITPPDRTFQQTLPYMVWNQPNPGTGTSGGGSAGATGQIDFRFDNQSWHQKAGGFVFMNVGNHANATGEVSMNIANGQVQINHIDNTQTPSQILRLWTDDQGLLFGGEFGVHNGRGTAGQVLVSSGTTGQGPSWVTLPGGTGAGTVTSVAALTLGTTGTDLTSTVANSTSTPVITLNVPTASASNRGALSSTDWSTFNSKGSMSTWKLTGDTGGTATIDDGETVDIAGTGSISTVRSGNTITISSSAGGGTMSSWDLTADSGGTATIDDGETVDIIGGTNITTVRASNNVTINNDITNNNQLTNGANYVTSSGVTSVNFKTDGNSLNVASNSITGSGTMTGVWQGTTSQYVNGEGDLITFPTIPTNTNNYVTGGSITSGVVTLSRTGLNDVTFNINNNQITNGANYTTNTGTVTGVTGTSPVVSSGGTAPAISMAAATTSVDGYLTSGNFTTFNNKMSNFLITADTGGSATIDNGETITIDGGTNITTSRSGNTITINSSGGGTVTSVSGGSGISITGTGTVAPTVNIDYSGSDNAILLTSAAVPVGADTIWFSDNDDSNIKKSVISNLPFAPSGTTTGVTSVNVVTDGDSLNVASNSITSSGTMTLNWQGSASQYVDGRGQLVTFPSTSGVTSVSGTAPIASSNTGSGATTISISQASSSSNGYLSSTDWTTFNNKGSGTVTGTGVSGRVAFWNGASSITNDSGYTFSTADDSVTVGKIKVGNGTEAAPSITFSNDTDSGWYMPATNQISLSINSTEVFGFGTAGIGVFIDSPLAPTPTLADSSTKLATTQFVKLQGYTTNTGTVTGVTGTAPVSVTSGTSPVVSMAAANGSTNGYLSSTDWTTFNNKTSNAGTVTSVGISHGGNAFTTGSAVTVSGTLAITMAGSSSQYVNGLGNLATFPTIGSGTVTSVSASNPATGSTAGSPLFISGTSTVNPTVNFVQSQITAVKLSDGTATGGVAKGTWNSNTQLNKTGSTDFTVQGELIYFGSNITTTQGALYVYQPGGDWVLADADAVSTSQGLIAIAIGEEVTDGMLTRGMFTLDYNPNNPGGSDGSILYLVGTAGQMYYEPPSGTGKVVRILATSLNASSGEIFFHPDNTFIELS